MKRLLEGLLLSAIVTTSFAAHAGTLEQSLEKLPDEERARQACILLGIDKIRRAGERVAKADRVKTSIFSQATFVDHVVATKGGAVRSNSQWYHLSFTCRVDDDLKHASNFEFEVGALIPESDWEDLGLWK